MASIRNEIALRATAGRVWDALRDFGAVHNAARARLRHRQQARWDDVRVVTFANGMVARETLVSSDDQRRRLVWTRSWTSASNTTTPRFRCFPKRAAAVWSGLSIVLPNDLAGHVGRHDASTAW